MLSGDAIKKSYPLLKSDQPLVCIAECKRSIT